MRRLLHQLAAGDVPLSQLDDRLSELGPVRGQLERPLRGVLGEWGLTYAREDGRTGRLKDPRTSVDGTGCVGNVALEQQEEAD